ncbi:PEP-CTERM sorting domain-containing protein [Acidibrevibacterium fodinaquatile]|uniref:PEP-CTERM sorting domain-containing protein n=1 Tax=Acidibrevibacterium fodinaquatile TaxID=1969806 RepID=UPI0013B44A3E|nr:PEP-CTERM sorting domain-containing protein [Acidibrevibacterium fodinaquatile]
MRRPIFKITRNERRVGGRGKLAAAFLLLAVGGLGVAAAPAMAGTVDYTLNDYVGSGTSSLASPYGTVALNDNGGPDVTVTVSLASGVGFVNSGAGYSLTWDLANAPSITVPANSITPGFSLVSSSAGGLSASGGGTWDYAIDCSTSTCGHGGNSPYTGPLSFTIDNVALSDFIPNGNGNYFGADVCLGVSNGSCGNGITGVVVANTAGVPGNSNVPEPATMVLLGSALFALAIVRRRGSHRPR